ncbi:MAG: MFS transporter [Ruminococcaceae bacterium]|nr:MFS transporter [Oscillospiraceae bacterium]
MKKENVTIQYAFVHMMLWALYGFLFSYANMYLTERLHLSDTRAGLVLGIATGLAFLLQPILTSVVDRTQMNVRHVSIACSLFTTITAMLTVLPLGKAATIVLFAGACVSLQTLPSFANALGMEGLRSGQKINFGLARGLGSVFFGVASRLAAPLIDHFTLHAVAVSGAICAAFLAVAVLIFPKGNCPLSHEESEQPSSAKEFFKENPKFIALLIGVVLLYIGHNALSNCMFRISESKLPIGAAQADITAVQGTALLIAALVELPMMFLFTRLVKKVRCDIWLILSCVFMTLRLILTLLLPAAMGLYIAQFAQMFGYALFAVASVYYVGTVVAKRNVVKGQTYLGSGNTMGCLGAYVLCGSLIDLVGVENMLIVSTVLSVIGIVCIVSGTERIKQTVGS